MDKSLQKTLFIHQNMESPLYYLSGTVVLSIAIIGLVLITIYSIYKAIKNNKNANYTKDLKELSEIALVDYLVILLASFFSFIVSIALFPRPIAEGWAENTGILIFIPFIAAVFIGGLGKVKALQNTMIIQDFTFWKMYLFSFLYLLFRVIFF